MGDSAGDARCGYLGSVNVIRLAELREGPLSVDEVRRFKPAPEVYLMAATKLDVDLDAMVMVASHDWDILGARSVGIPGAFIARSSVVWGSSEPLPDLTGPDLGAIADALIV